MSVGDILLRDVLHQILLYFARGVSSFRYQAHAMAHPIDVCVNRHGSLSKPYGTNHIGSFSPDARQSGQLCHLFRHFTPKISHHLARHFRKMLRFGVGIADALDEFVYILHFRLRHALDIRITSKQGRSHHIDALVCALSRE